MDDNIKIWDQEWKNNNNNKFDLLFTNRLFIEVFAVIKKYLKIGIKNEFLEIGAGTGRYGVKIAMENPQANFTLTDPTESSVKLMNELVNKYNLDNVKAIQSFAENLPFLDETFDIVFSDVVLQHIVKPELALKEMKRVLKSDGKLIVTVVNIYNPFHSFYKFWLKFRGIDYMYGHEQSYSHESLSHLLNQCGFKVVVKDGAYPAYGLYRHKYKYPILGFIAKAINRTTTNLDKITNNVFRKYFGFEIIVFAEKKYE
jgi:ubiquinone/menaquinone biosynthesis C-methylase UbiE